MDTPSRFRMAPPAWLVLFLAPVIGELLSGSAPPAEFFQPIGFIMLVLLYGVGALLCRELAFAWRKGWLGLLLLGAAYGVLEEGLAVMSFFNPAWVDLGPMAGYGRWIGVNWVWTVNLTVYHTFISVATPVVIANLCFPAWREQSWTGIHMRKILWVLLALDTAFIIMLFGLMVHYMAPLPALLMSAVVIVFLGWLASRMPEGRLSPGTDAPRTSPLLFGVFGFLALMIYFMQMYILPSVGVPAGLTLVIALTLFAFGTWLLRRMTGNGHAWGERHQAALVTGALWVFVLLAFLAESDNANRPDNTTGMSIVGIVALLLTVALLRVVRKRRNTSTQPKPTECASTP